MNSKRKAIEKANKIADLRQQELTLEKETEREQKKKLNLEKDAER